MEKSFFPKGLKLFLSKAVSFPQKQDLSCKKGFTLIELVVVLSIVAIMSTLALAAFSEYSKIATLHQATLDVANMLELARYNSLSQVDSVGGQTCSSTSYPEFYGYSFNITGTSYEIDILCDQSPTGISSVLSIYKKANLNKNVSFVSPTDFFILFPILANQTNGQQVTGTGSSPYRVTVESYGKTETIWVYSSGVIHVD